MIVLPERLWSGRGGRYELPSRLSVMYVQLTSGVNGVYVQLMESSETQSVRFEMRAGPGWLARVDEWRRSQPDLPSRAEAIRRLVEKALS